MNFQALNSQEVLQTPGLPTSADAQIDPLDNQMVEEMLRTGALPQTDKLGRPIISFSQYLRLRKKGDLSRYSLWMSRPGVANKAWTMQASKYMKYFRDGYEAVGAPVEHRHSVEELVRSGMPHAAALMYVRERDAKPKERTSSRQMVEPDAGETVTVFKCADKYPECGRFFDKAEGLKAHWGRDHGEWKAKKNTPKEE